MYVYDGFIFFSSACFVQQHPLRRQPRWPLWAILHWCEAGCNCFVTLGKRVRSSPLSHPSATDYLHQLIEAESDGLNSFCVIYSEEPALPHPLWRTTRSQGRCTHPGWPKSPPAQAGHLQPWFMATATCRALHTSICVRPCRLKPTLPLKLVLGSSPSIVHCIPKSAWMFSPANCHYSEGPGWPKLHVSGSTVTQEPERHLPCQAAATCPCWALQIIASTTAAKPPATKCFHYLPITKAIYPIVSFN